MARLMLCVLCAIFFGNVESASILGIFPFPGKSHYFMFEKVMKALAESGHEVDIYTHFLSKNAVSRYNQISLLGTLPIVTNNFSADVAEYSFVETLNLMTEAVGTDICRKLFDSDQMRNLKVNTKKYDVIITELFASECMLAWGHHFGIPVVGMLSSYHLPWTGDRFGLPDNPSYVPNYFSGRASLDNFFHRLSNTIQYVIAKWYHSTVYETQNEIARNFFGSNLPDLRQLAFNVSLFLVNAHYSTNGARPLPPNVVEVAGAHIRKPKPLNSHFMEILRTDKKGVIYLTMGSVMQTETFPIATLQSMFDAFAELPYKVVWKAIKSNFSKELRFPDNIHFEKWMPQIDILCDPNVKLFVSHGGMLGSLEAIYCGVPVLGIPLFADQTTNIAVAETKGYAIRVDYKNISRDSILHAAKTLLEDTRYQENAKKISENFKDRPREPLDEAIYWINYVIKHKGAPELRSAAARLSWYQYFLVDVIASIAVSFCTFIFFVYVGLRAVFIRKQLKQKSN
ncbi:UDP-glucosyltransferase 2-like isoform X2 [Cylas formicarius]|uniref:UDP-glucosyltransferase 2-like isoform X2 n=1 Tax=Cylas formicarius TaxID=197179 RepID=UPI0029584891|nr:UDP-glucosyltransferase 2-like isoform X2 [Cylas formicarius]